MGFLGKNSVDLFQLIPVAGGRQVYFEKSGVGGKAEGAQALVGRRWVAFEPDGHLQVLAGVFDCGDEVEVVGEYRGVGEKDVQAVFADLYAEGWADEFGGCFGGAGERGQRIGGWLL